MLRSYAVWDGRDSFEKELKLLAEKHPDPSRRNLYGAMFEMIIEADEQLLNFLVPFLLTLSERKMSTSHFLNLFVHTHVGEYLFLVHHFKLDDTELRPKEASGKSYEDFSIEDWKTVLHLLLETCTLVDRGGERISPVVEASQELRERSTQTFQISRYYGPYLFLNIIGLTSELRIADVGCSLGIALKMMASGLNIPVKHSPEILKPNKMSSLSYNAAYAFDIAEILDPQTIDWILACCAYPQESRTAYPQLLSEYRQFQPSPDDAVTYFTGEEGDMMQLNKVGNSALNVIIVNTTLYQLHPTEVEHFIQIASETLEPGGWLIISDFVHIEDNSLVFADTWFKSNGEQAKRTYRTLVAQKLESGQLGPWQELYQFNNARCNQIFAGEDYRALVESHINVQEAQSIN